MNLLIQSAKGRSGQAPLDLYLNTISDGALLTAVEECSLAQAIAQGDRQARNHLIEANLKLVIRIARGYLGKGLSLEDLIGEGNLGLIRAATEYDPSFGTRFSTYAAYWIKQAIRHALTNTTATIRLPAHMVNLLRKWRRIERHLTREQGYAPSPDQIAAELGLSTARRDLVDRALRAGRIHGEGGSGSDETTWLPDEVSAGDEAPEVPVEADDDRCNLLRRLERLDDRERTILALRFGLDGEAPLSLKQIGQRLGVTREWVRKIELRAILKLSDSELPPATRPRRLPMARSLQLA